MAALKHEADAERTSSDRCCRPLAEVAYPLTQTLFVNQIVGAPTTPAFCIAFFNSALLANACAASSVANSWVTVMSLGLLAAWYTAAAFTPSGFRTEAKSS